MFDAAVNFDWLRGTAVELHCSLRVSVEGLNHALQFGRTAVQIKRLSDINASDVHGHLLFSALLL